MKLTPKVLLISTLMGFVSLSGLARMISANPLPNVTRPSVSSLMAKNKDENSHLRSLAKISPQQAQQSAEKAMGARASHVKLENEDGDLVYSVQIGKAEVKVDAGNGKVLYTDTPNNENEHSEKTHPHSSIRLTEGPNGDGDGETNDDG